MSDLAVPLAPFLCRPPTPPRESTSRFTEESDLTIALASNKSLDTPEESPSSSAEYFRNGSSGAKKKVVISAWRQYHQPPCDSSKGYDSDDLRTLPPSRECKPAASILKHSSDLSALDSGNDTIALDTSNVPAMLRSAALHLNSDSRASRLDAYNSLLACLSAYEDIPNAHQFTAKVTEILGCVRRDLTSKGSGGASVDIQIATRALKLVVVLLCMPSLVGQVSEDFRHFIVEQSITSLGDEKAPKIIVSHYLHLLEKQKFGFKTMSTERANRLLFALDSITTRVKGTRIAGHRLMIYQRLLHQAKSAMASKSGSWMNHLISGLLCTVKDIRNRAITFGTEAGLRLGGSATVSQAFSTMLNHQSPDGRRVVELLCARMQEMAASREDGQQVPQMWSVAILFLRSRRRQVECWDHIKAWLDVLEKCFNSTDAQIKFQANLAWNHLIFCVDIDMSTSSSMAKMLKAPIVAQLERKQNEKPVEKKTKLIKQVARSSYCTLLYYALRPGVSYAQLDQYWDLYVADVLTNSISRTGADVNYACEILAALLFNDGQPRLWNNNRANMIGPTTSKELPCLDPKWIRSRVGKVIQVFGRLFDWADWAVNEGRSAPIVIAWQSFMASLGSAGSKEVKVSSDTMVAIAQIVNQVQSLLSKAGEIQSRASIYEHVGVLLHEALSKIGALAFNEKRLALTTQSAFEAVPETPSSRLKNSPVELNSAAVHLLRLLLQKPISYEHTACIDTIKKIVQVALESSHTRQGRLSTLRGVARLCASDCDTVPSESRLILWQVIADAGISTLQLQRASDSHDRSSQHPGHEYRDTAKILEIAFHHQSMHNFLTWQKLYDRLVETLRQEVGPAAIMLVVYEPLTGFIQRELVQKHDEFSLNAAVKIIERVQWVTDRHSLERTHMQLWGAIQGHHKSIPLDLPEDMYSLITTSLKQGYAVVTSLPPETASSLLSAVTSLVHSCPSDLKAKLLVKVHYGVALWIEDQVGALSGLDKLVLPKVKKLWASIILLIEGLHEFSSQTLFDIHILITASLRSRHKSILYGAISLWNRTFGCAENLEYPDDLSKALLKLESIVDINIPGLTNRTAEEHPSPFRFLKSQDADDLGTDVKEYCRRVSPELWLPSSGTPLKNRFSSYGPSLNPLVSARRNVKRTPKARLHHDDDSQIQFASIKSSPLLSKGGDPYMLTERQKEVKERQQHEAALFPEIRSSGGEIPKTRDHRLPKLDLKSNQAPKVSLNPDDEASPTFPPDNMMNGFLGSSPTPGSSRHRSSERLSESEPASSPPFVSSNLQLSRPANLSPTPRSGPSQGVHEEPSLPVLRENSQNRTASVLTGSHMSYHVPHHHQKDPISKSNIFSDKDVFVDAPSEPQIRSDEEHRKGLHSEGQSFEDTTRPIDQAPSVTAVSQPEAHVQKVPPSSQEGERNKIMSSFQSEASARLSADDEQAAAQLLAEMENAHSQTPQRRTLRTSRAASRKRKASTEGTSKKRRRTSIISHASSGVQRDLARGEVMADCVLIESRPMEGAFQLSRSQAVIKRERSESPGVGAFLSTGSPMPTPSRPRSGRQKPAARNEPASQDSSSTRRSGRKGSSRQAAGKEDEEQGLQPGRRTGGGSKRTSDVARDSPLSSDPLHGEDDMLPSSLSVSGMEVPQSDLAGPSRAQQPGLGRSAGEPGGVSHTGQGILERFRSMFEDLKSIALGPEEERAMMTLLFGSVQQIHEAGRRHSRT